MARSPDTSDWHKRYAVIEKVYCEGRWATVMESGARLLRELLEAEGEPEVMALRHRMQLLMAHTLLHGYGDRDAAEDLYELVRSSGAEPALRQMAEDGLDQCHQPLMSNVAMEEDDDVVPSQPWLFLPETERTDLEEAVTPSQGAKPRSPASQMPPMPLRPSGQPEAEEETVTPALANPRVAPPPTEERPSDLDLAADPFAPSGSNAPSPGHERTEPVMPWLSEPSSANVSESVAEPALPWLPPQALIPDVVDEPELIEVHQATPSLAEEVDLNIKRARPSDPVDPSPHKAEEDGDLRTGLLLVVLS